MDSIESWSDWIGPVLSAKEVQQILGLERVEEVSRLAAKGLLLELSGGSGETGYPSFQFTTRRTIPGLQEILLVFNRHGIDRYTIASWFQTSSSFLDSLSPASWLRAGREPSAAIIAAVRSATELSA